METLINKQARKKSYGLFTFCYALAMAIVLFLPFILYNNGYFLYYGDFNVQQIPFYQMVHDSILNGDTMWSTTTDLGANLLGSFSFYLISSPFFLLTLLFPSKAVPYLIAPLLSLKIAFAALLAYVYIKRYVKDKRLAVIGGILYGFSGFSIYNIFFNHFHEAIVALPLLLLAVDSYMYDRKKGLVVLGVFYSCTVNYYFFVGQAVFVIIYWFVKIISKEWKINVKDFILLAFEVLLGFLMSFAVLIPSILTIIDNPRIDRPIEGWGALLYFSEQRYIHILQSMFFPPDIPARPNFTPDSNAKWASLSAYIPLFGMIGTISYLQLRKRDWLKKVITILFICAFIPIFNSVFQLLNSTYYARWFYMLCLMFALATVKALEDEKVQWKRGFLWSFAITLFMVVAIGFMPLTETVDGTEKTKYGLEAYPERFWIYAGIAFISHLVVLFLIKALKGKSKHFFKGALACTTIASMVMGYYVVTLGATHGYNSHDFIIPYCLNNGEDVKLDDIKNVRSDFYSTMDNVGMYWQIPNIQAFQSIVPGSIMEFYPTVGVERNVHSKPDVKYYGLRGLLSCKYLFSEVKNNKFIDEEGTTKMPGWTYKSDMNGYCVYENEYYIPYGFTFNKYMSEEEYMKCPVNQRHLLLLKSLVLSDEDIEKYSYLFDEQAQYTDFYYTENEYYKDCKELQQNSSDSFSYVNNGFKATYTSKENKDQLLFFSVPYEDGWTAKVNGKDAEIIKSSIGFMSVVVKGGQTNEIEFSYKTPGLDIGMIISLGSIFIYIVYMFVVVLSAKKQNDKKPVHVKNQRIEIQQSFPKEEETITYTNTSSIFNDLNEEIDEEPELSVFDQAVIEQEIQEMIKKEKFEEEIINKEENLD